MDTDHLSLLQREHPSVMQRLSLVNPREIAITVITAEEQLRGRLDVIRRASQESQIERLVEAYRGLQETIDDLKSLNILDFDRAAYSCYRMLRQQRTRIGTQDLRIAAVVQSVNGTLVTRNQRDFAQVPGLQIVDWTIV